MLHHWMEIIVNIFFKYYTTSGSDFRTFQQINNLNMICNITFVTRVFWYF